MKKLNLLLLLMSFILGLSGQIINREQEWILRGNDTIFVDDLSINNNSNEVKLKYTSQSGEKFVYKGSECSKFKSVYNDGDLFDYVNYLRDDKKCYIYAIRVTYGAICLNSNGDLSETFIKLPSGKWYWCYGKPLNKTIIPKLLECNVVNDTYGKVDLLDKNRLILMARLYNESCSDTDIEEK